MSEIDYRSYVLGLDTKIPIDSGEYVSPINFDNAATTPPFKYVLREINKYSPWYSSIHRGTGYKSKYSSRLFEEAREIICDFVNADHSDDSIIFVKNATEGLNKLAYRLKPLKGKDVVLSTSMEHHSNDLPWRDKFHVDYIDIDKNGRLSMDDFINKLERYKNRVRLVAVSGASNVTGYVNPIYKIAELCHSNDTEVLVDGAQLVPHSPINMQPENPNQKIDYLVFSAHKMYAPFGIGVLIGPRSTFIDGAPEYTGGGTIDIVTQDYVKWAEPPHSDEAGSPNIIGVVALAAAIDILNHLEMDNILKHEKKITKYAMERMKKINDIRIYGDTEKIDDKLGIITFNIESIHHTILANILSYESGIAVRNGCFCAHPYVIKLLNVSKKTIQNSINNPTAPRPGMVRLSFGLYNTTDEIDLLINTLNKVIKNKEYYINKYEMDVL